jgi:hypothetical protein
VLHGRAAQLDGVGGNLHGRLAQQIEHMGGIKAADAIALENLGDRNLESIPALQRLR